MKKFCSTAAMAALLLFCSNSSFAQSPSNPKHTLGIEMVSLIRQQQPLLAYNLKLSKGTLRTRIGFSFRSPKSYPDLTDIVDENYTTTRTLYTTMAVGWQKEIRKNRFGFYWGGEALGTLSTGRSAVYYDQEQTANSIAFERFRENTYRYWETGISGIIGARFYPSDKFSFGFETGTPFTVKFYNDKSLSYDRETTETGYNYLDLEKREISRKEWNFRPFQNIFLFLNFHI